MSPYICPDCTKILGRIEQLELGDHPAINRSVAKPDPEWSKAYEHYENTEQFQESEFYRKYLPEDDSMEHKSTRTALLESASSGCCLCHWLLNSLDSRSQMSMAFEQTRYRRRPAVVRKDPRISPLGMRCIGHYYVSIRCARDDRVWPVSLGRVGLDTHRSAYQDYVGDEKASLIVDSLRMISKESPHFMDAMASLDDTSPSASVWTLVESWLELCTSSHPDCQSQALRDSKEMLPTRLLDIQDPYELRMVPLSTFATIKTPRYATLSYRRGQTSALQLNKETLDTLRQGIRISELPATFRDAIIVARTLKIPYLWIDTLCILQDCVHDWEEESIKMGSIYNKSYLCIAATAGKDDCSGFLETRDLTHKRPLIYNDLVIQEDVSMKNHNLNMQQITWCDRMRSLVDWGVESAPLNQCAWTFQQRMLAPRILHCTADEFIWECGRGMRSESHPLLTNGSSVVKDAWKQLLQTPPGQPLESKPRKAMLERWSELIATYSATQDKRMEDKLIAFSAIAKEFQPILGIYAAGLWREYLPSQLLWLHHPFCRIRHDSKPDMRPRSKPSWSWASLDCRVELPYYYDAARDPDFNTNNVHTFGSEPIDLSTSALVEVLDVYVNLREKDPTGLVDDGRISLSKSQLFPLYHSAAFGWKLEMDPPDAFEHNVPVRWRWDDPDSLESAAETQVRIEAHKPDGPEEAMIMSTGSARRINLIHEKKLAHHFPKLTRLCCLPIAVTSKTGVAKGCQNGTVSGLMIEYTGEAAGQYRRVGHFWCGRDYLDTIPRLQPTPHPTLPCEWPSSEQYDLKNGYIISLV